MPRTSVQATDGVKSSVGASVFPWPNRDFVIHAPLPLQAAEATSRPAATRITAAARLRCYALLLAADLACLIVAFLLGNLVRFGDALATAGLNYLAIVVPVFVAMAFSNKAYSIESLRNAQESASRALKTLAITACALLLGLFYAKLSAEMSRAVFGTGIALAALLLIGVRYTLTRRVAHALGHVFENEVWLVDGVPAPYPGAANTIYAESEGLDPFRNDPVTASRISDLLKGCDRVMLNCTPQRRLAWVKYLKGVGVNVEVLTPELDNLGALGMRRTVNGAAVLVSIGPMGLRARILKRALDVILASLMLIFFAPLMLATALAVKVSSRGPVLFTQPRIGLGNRSFKLVKFRTMRVDACDLHGTVSTRRDDDRLTPVGRFLRRTSIDELPQLFNVLRGTMSIVGPRPHAAESTAENDLFWHIDDRYWERGAVKPGITGLAQIRGYRGATLTRKDLRDRVRSDLEYLLNWSILKDLLIICRTIRVIVHPNAY